MKRFLTIGIFLTVLTMVVTAQNTFSGIVKDTKGQAIPFATVQILKTDSTLVTGAITDDDGKYTLSFSSEETQKYLLHVSFVGYKTQVLHLDSKTTNIRDVILEEEGRRLIEVVLPFNSYPTYYIQKPYINPITGKGHWINEHYDRSKNKMIRRFKEL